MKYLLTYQLRLLRLLLQRNGGATLKLLYPNLKAPYHLLSMSITDNLDLPEPRRMNSLRKKSPRTSCRATTRARSGRIALEGQAVSWCDTLTRTASRATSTVLSAGTPSPRKTNRYGLSHFLTTQYLINLLSVYYGVTLRPLFCVPKPFFSALNTLFRRHPQAR